MIDFDHAYSNFLSVNTLDQNQSMLRIAYKLTHICHFYLLYRLTRDLPLSWRSLIVKVIEIAVYGTLVDSCYRNWVLVCFFVSFFWRSFLSLCSFSSRVCMKNWKNVSCKFLRWNYCKLLLTLSVPEKIKNSIFEIPIIPQTLKLQSSKLCSNKHMIASTQTTNTEMFGFIALVVFKLLSRKVLLLNRKDKRNC